MKKTLSILAMIGMTAAPLGALAQGAPVTATAHLDAEVNAGAGAGVQAQVQVKADLITKAKNRADQEITRRIGNLTKMEDRIASTTHISADGKASIATTIDQQISALKQLDSKIQADDSTTTLRDDLKSITSSYRIYALVMPQLALTAAADRVMDISEAMNTLESKLEARLSASTTASTTANADAMSALEDMKTQIAAAQQKATDAVNATIALKPDNGDKTVMQSNLAALKDARSKIQGAQQDLVVARKDMRTIYQALHVNASAHASTSAEEHASATSTVGQE